MSPETGHDSGTSAHDGLRLRLCDSSLSIAANKRRMARRHDRLVAKRHSGPKDWRRSSRLTLTARQRLPRRRGAVEVVPLAVAAPHAPLLARLRLLGLQLWYLVHDHLTQRCSFWPRANRHLDVLSG